MALNKKPDHTEIENYHLNTNNLKPSSEKELDRLFHDIKKGEIKTAIVGNIKITCLCLNNGDKFFEQEEIHTGIQNSESNVLVISESQFDKIKIRKFLDFDSKRFKEGFEKTKVKIEYGLAILNFNLGKLKELSTFNKILISTITAGCIIMYVNNQTTEDLSTIEYNSVIEKMQEYGVKDIGYQLSKYNKDQTSLNKLSNQINAKMSDGIIPYAEGKLILNLIAAKELTSFHDMKPYLVNLLLLQNNTTVDKEGKLVKSIALTKGIEEYYKIIKNKGIVIPELEERNSDGIIPVKSLEHVYENYYSVLE